MVTDTSRERAIEPEQRECRLNRGQDLPMAVLRSRPTTVKHYVEHSVQLEQRQVAIELDHTARKDAQS